MLKTNLSKINSLEILLSIDLRVNYPSVILSLQV